MIKSQAIRYKDYTSHWYKKWSVLLKQENGLYDRKIHNKAWQNAIMLQALFERGYLKPGNKALGFGVGTERVPSALATLGLHVTATDQELESGVQAGWDNLGQITHSRDDLNQYGIAPKNTFNKNVEFKNCDMTKISKKFNTTYDIVWSNCALGHLGSLDAGLEFIEKSLDALKPGGIAVHTTEINVTSDTETLDRGGTVIFRQGDMINLFYKLREKGYKCAPLSLNFGSTPEDMVFSAFPYEDDPLLKLIVGRHLVSQMVLIIKKPRVLKKSKLASIQKKAELRINSSLITSYRNRNENLQVYLASQNPTENNGITPLTRTTKLVLKPKQIASVRIKFKNSSPHHYYDTYQILKDGNPLIIATAKPINHKSIFATPSWISKTRPVLQFDSPTGVKVLEGICPGATFWADIPIKAPLKPGIYVDHFCFVLEGSKIIKGSDFTIQLSVRK